MTAYVDTEYLNDYYDEDWKESEYKTETRKARTALQKGDPATTRDFCVRAIKSALDWWDDISESKILSIEHDSEKTTAKVILKEPSEWDTFEFCVNEKATHRGTMYGGYFIEIHVEPSSTHA